MSVALVTGAAGGLGAAIAARLAQEHAVLLTDVQAELLAEVSDNLAAGGAKVAHTVCDVSDRASVQAAYAVAEEHLGEVDTLANVAGLGLFRPFMELTEEMWDRTYAVNVRGTFLTCQELLSRRNGRPGAIVNISSVASRLGVDMLADYGSSKAAVTELSHSLARIGAPTGLRVNAVMPGLIYTDMWRTTAEYLIASGAAPAEATPEQVFAGMVESMCPMKRPQTAADVAEMVGFLLSDNAINITGQSIAVDGGIVMT